ncbi:unnamed protein product [Citrullus colocynthis]|uniref:Uncharacterized protein n=1 Tax=Citrullus colocynthis TaxID=252529 RepID=A0ABP0Y9N0_9ROSI
MILSYIQGGTDSTYHRRRGPPWGSAEWFSGSAAVFRRDRHSQSARTIWRWCNLGAYFDCKTDNQIERQKPKTNCALDFSCIKPSPQGKISR